MDTNINSITATGLTTEEVNKRKASGLINGEMNVKTKSVWQILAKNTFTFFNFLFFAFAIILAFFVDKGEDGVLGIDDFGNFGFVFVVFINLFLGVFQELKAKHTIDKLSLLSAPKVSVLRDGKESDILLKDIVMDDIIMLSAGRQICSDSIVVEGNIEVNESLITGEPDAIPKAPGDELLSGSFVVSGTAKSKVIRIGKDNYATKITSGAKKIKAPNSEILRSLTRFIKYMAIIIVPIGVALFLVKYLRLDNRALGLGDTVNTVIGSLIGMIPSGLVMLTSAVFCVSVVRLSKYKTLAQDLYCTETLARINVLCLDKTGTLTEGKMEVCDIITYGGEDAASVKSVLKNIVTATKDKNPTADAVNEYLSTHPVSLAADAVIPFSSKRKWSGAVFGNESFVMGASEFIFKDIDSELKTQMDEYAADGFRIISVARVNGKIVDEQFPCEPILMGYLLITDKIRKEAPATLRYFAEQGVTIKIISGDNPVTVKSIAKRAGVADYDSYIDASTLTPDSIPEAVSKYTIFGRVTPDQKLDFVKALKAQGKTVAMTGDGVNDVLALKEADCAIAVASGSDAAKNVAQLVLLDDNFSSMPKVVAEGRRTINNLERSAALYIVKTLYNLFLALAFMIIDSDLPFEPKHLTLIGALTIGIPSCVLALEPNSELIRGHFFTRVINNALPSALTVVISVIAVTLSSRIFPNTIDGAQISTMCTIVAVIIGFLYIAKISRPFNKIRLTLLVSMMALFVLSFFCDFGFLDMRKMFGLSTDFNIDMVKILVPISVLCIPLFMLDYFLMGKLNRHHLVDKICDKLKIS